MGNLLCNAAKYTEPGGTIRLTATCEAGQVSISVRDSGIGIAPDVMPRLFEMFMQGCAGGQSIARRLGHWADAGKEPDGNARWHHQGAK